MNEIEEFVDQLEKLIEAKIELMTLKTTEDVMKEARESLIKFLSEVSS